MRAHNLTYIRNRGVSNFNLCFSGLLKNKSDGKADSQAGWKQIHIDIIIWSINQGLKAGKEYILSSKYIVLFELL